MKQFVKELSRKYDLHDIDTIVIKNGKVVDNAMVSNATISMAHLQRSDLYRIASISKLFVGIAIMQLVEKGVISLDDNIEDYVGFTVRNTHHKTNTITIKHLLTHTSSLQDTDINYVPYGMHSKELFVTGGKLYKDSMCSTHKPGDVFIYYNAGFHLLAITIEKTSNMRFDKYIEQHILNPLSMKGSFNVAQEYTSKHIRPLFRKHDGIWVPQCDNDVQTKQYDDYVLGTNGSLFSPQGGMRSNAYELHLLMLDLLNDEPTILSRESLSYMTQIHYKDTHTDIDYGNFYRNSGIVFNIINNDCINKPIKEMNYTLIGHCGLAYGFHGIFFFDKKHKNGLICNITGEGKPLSDYRGNHSQYFAFLEDMFQYVHNNIWFTK
jgi:CubicO group peptidase (beta-lactamase class C family)